MYLELSRPQGEVSRWPKVFERLSLFNEFVPVKHCHVSKSAFHGSLNKEQVKYTLNYIIQNKRIFAGSDLVGFYDTALKQSRQHPEWIITSKKPIIFFSSNANEDAKQIRSEFNFLKSQIDNQKKVQNQEPITIKSYSSRGVDLIPSLKIITQGKKSLVFIIEQTACHSYFNIPIEDNKILRIASLDTLITLYFSLGLFDSKYFDMGSLECLANNLVQISIKARNNAGNFIFPFISIKCTGHQTSLPSLIRAKVRRITSKKTELKKLLNNNESSNNISNRRKTLKQNNFKKFFNL
jgi:hypothetical protein